MENIGDFRSNPRKVVSFVFLVALVIGILYILLSINGKISTVRSDLDFLSQKLQAQLIVSKFIQAERFDGERIFCKPSNVEAPVCKAITFQTFSAFGNHPPLWVVFDGMNSIIRDSSDGYNIGLLRSWADLAVSLNEFGALSILDSNEKDRLYYSIDLYVATLALAKLCVDVQPTVICEAGLPVGVRKPLSSIVGIIIQRLEKTAGLPENESRLRAARFVLKSGLI